MENDHFIIPTKLAKEEKPYLFILNMYLQLKDSERLSHFGNELLRILSKTLDDYECPLDMEDRLLILTKSSAHDRIRLLLGA